MKDIIMAFIGLDKQTRENTIAAALTAIFDFLAVFGIISFPDEQRQAILKLVLTIVTGFVWAYCSHYKNNCNTKENLEATENMRQRKIEAAAGYVGERFFDDLDEEDVDE